MARPSGNELGVRSAAAYLRAERRGFRFRGVSQQKDRGSLDPGKLSAGENIRFRGGRVDCRGGCTSPLTTPLGGAITGIFDDWEG
ncbi:MAG TPA: hypothetical protein VMZ50_05355 [Phycisphaerae bacterium]|nr:hypothetical protein [Phycisphaerae bacterium]